MTKQYENRQSKHELTNTINNKMFFDTGAPVIFLDIDKFTFEVAMYVTLDGSQGVMTTSK